MLSDNVKKILATVLLIGILFIAGLLTYPYLQDVFWALILFTLFNPLYKWFVRKGLKPGLSAVIVLLVSIGIVLVPLITFGGLIVNEATHLFTEDNVNEIITKVSEFDLGDFDIRATLEENASSIRKFVTGILSSIVNTSTSFFLHFFITYILLFYCLVEQKKLAGVMRTFLPFNKTNSETLVSEFKTITTSTILTTGIIATLQGGILGICLFFLGVPGSITLGVLGIILSFIPLVGIFLIWAPAALILYLFGNVVGAIIVLVVGIVLSNIDNFIRPVLQNKFGKMHPILTLIGVFIGLPVFGILGLIMGPLILSFTYYFVVMYKEEYL